MRNLFLILLVALISVPAVFANGTEVNGIDFYAFESKSLDSAGQARSAKDTLGDTLDVTGSLWYDLGPIPSTLSDSGVLILQTAGARKVACSLFVSLSRDPKRLTNTAWLKYVTGNSSLITDSANSDGAHTYALPPLAGKRGYRMVLKLYEYGSGTKGAIKKVGVIRDKK